MRLSERALSGGVAWDPTHFSRCGPRLTLRQTVGEVDALFSPATLARAVPRSGRVEARLAYGLPVFGGWLTGTPEAGIVLDESDSRPVSVANSCRSGPAERPSASASRSRDASALAPWMMRTAHSLRETVASLRRDGGNSRKTLKKHHWGPCLATK